MPKVSVIMSSYNHENFVEQCVNSVLTQSYSDFEFIIIDDNSIDATAEKIASFKDSRIQFTALEENRGQYFNTNESIKSANSEYVAIINSDDFWQIDKLKQQVEFLDKNSGYGAVFTFAKGVNKFGNKTFRSKMDSNFFKSKNRNRQQWLYRLFFQKNNLCHPSVLYRKNIHQEVGFYNHNYFNLADMDFWIRTLQKHEIHIIPKELTNFRVFRGQGSKNKHTRNRCNFEYFGCLDNYLNIKNFDELKKIFPKIRAKNKDTDLIPYHIAKYAIDTAIYPMAYFWGLNILEKMLVDENLAKKLKENFDFNYTDFIKLTGKRKIFHQSLYLKIKDGLRKIFKFQK